MFENYTLEARRTVFHGRYQASLFGSTRIEVEHLLLGLLQADIGLCIRLFKSPEKLHELRHKIEVELPRGEQVAISTDIPLSDACKDVLAAAADEASRLSKGYIGPEHLLLAIARTGNSVAARLVLESGVTFSELEQEARQPKSMAAAATASPARTPLRAGTASAGITFTPTSKALPDLVAEARAGTTEPLIGRSAQLEQVLQILSRRSRNSVVLLGAAGVGKEALVYGLADRMADENVPAPLVRRSILRIEAAELARALEPTRRGSTAVLAAVYDSDDILYVRGLFERRDLMPEVAAFLRSGQRMLITTASPVSFRLALERDEELARCFEPVMMPAASEEETIQIVEAAKHKFESFHHVVVTDAATETALAASARFLRDRTLPERVLDLIDEAAAAVRVRGETAPPELAAMQRRLRAIERAEEKAILSRNPVAAGALSDEKQTVQQELARLRAQWEARPPANNVVGPDEIVEVVAARSSIPVESVRAALAQPLMLERIDEVRNEISARVPPGRRDWIEGLVSYLSDCAPHDADRLMEVLKSAKAKLRPI